MGLLINTVFLIAGLSIFNVESLPSNKNGNKQNEDWLVGTFPENFQWGLCTSAYQIEGGWNEDGKGENIWDYFVHKNPSPIANNETGDIACDSYHKYAEDVQLLKNMNADYYRFSISWTRILPLGTLDVINQDGIDYYNRLIDLLIENGIAPMITLYHFDLPQALQNLNGGWPNEDMIEHFGNFARLVFGAFGDRVKTWITINEPWVICINGYGNGGMAPGVNDEAEAPYKCVHTMIKSHARVYRIYESEFKPHQNGRVSIVADSGWYEPADPENESDVQAAERALQFKHGWVAGPLYNGKYPDIMRELIDSKSVHEGRNVSRLPSFDPAWSLYVKGTLDFLSLNHYTTELVTSSTGGSPGWDGDQNTSKSQDPEWPDSATPGLKSVPWGFRKVLNWIKNTYGNPEVVITGNGSSDNGTLVLEDQGRIDFFNGYINNLLQAVNLDGCNVTAYTAWSLMDNFEWGQAYTQRFGTHWVNFTDPERPRIPKLSTAVLTQIFTDNGFPDSSKPGSKIN